MILHVLNRRRRQATIEGLYGAIVAQARHPVFYREYAVPDTVNARFEMIVLHLSLFLDLMQSAGAAARETGQDVFDLFCSELDGHVREQGTGDLKVPREMRKLGGVFYGRQRAYRNALAQADDATLALELDRNIYSGSGGSAGSGRLARYVRTAADSLSRQADMQDRGPAWPSPETISAGER